MVPDPRSATQMKPSGEVPGSTATVTAWERVPASPLPRFTQGSATSSVSRAWAGRAAQARCTQTSRWAGPQAPQAPSVQLRLNPGSPATEGATQTRVGAPQGRRAWEVGESTRAHGAWRCVWRRGAKCGHLRGRPASSPSPLCPAPEEDEGQGRYGCAETAGRAAGRGVRSLRVQPVPLGHRHKVWRLLHPTAGQRASFTQQVPAPSLSGSPSRNVGASKTEHRNTDLLNRSVY